MGGWGMRGVGGGVRVACRMRASSSSSAACFSSVRLPLPPPPRGRGRADPAEIRRAETRFEPYSGKGGVAESAPHLRMWAKAEIRRRRISSSWRLVTNHITRTIHAPLAFEYELAFECDTAEIQSAETRFELATGDDSYGVCF